MSFLKAYTWLEKKKMKELGFVQFEVAVHKKTTLHQAWLRPEIGNFLKNFHPCYKKRNPNFPRGKSYCKLQKRYSF